MRRPIAILLAILIVAVSWLFFKHFDIRGLGDVSVVAKSLSSKTRSTQDDWGQLAFDRNQQTKASSIFDRFTKSTPKIPNTIRVASFNVQSLGDEKAANFEVMAVLAKILRNFDVISIQELRANRPNVLPSLVDMVNGGKGKYDYHVEPQVGSRQHTEQCAFIFNRDRVLLDREAVYTVDDPDNIMECDPLVGWFRARGPNPKTAFTFSMVNVHVQPNRRHELDVLDDVLYAIRRDGRNEDDVILAGDFGADRSKLGQLGDLPGLVTAIVEPTNTRGTAQRDNIITQLPATEEFNNRSGVFDFMREYNLSLEQALQVSDHLPVWAEFSTYEGGQPGRSASASASNHVARQL